MLASRNLWKHGDFVKLWGAKTVSDFGSLISGTALSFTAIIYLRATPSQLGLLMAANLLPRFLVGPAAGLLADRLPRRSVMIGSDLGRAVLLSTIPLAALCGRLQLWHLYLVTAMTGLFTLLFNIADRSYLPTLVPSDALVEANSRLTATSSVAEFSGFSLAGWLVQWFTGPIAILIDAASFVFSALCLGLIRKAEPPRERVEYAAGMRGEFLEGWTTLRRNPLLLSLAGVTLLAGLTGGVEGTVMVAFMVRGLGFHPGVLGMIWSIGGISSLAGALLASRLIRRIKPGLTLTLGLLVSAIGVLAVPLAYSATWMAAGFLVANQLLTDSAYTVFDIQQTSLRQAEIPDRLQGRVNSLFETVGLGATLAGAMIGGLLGERLGLRAAVALGAGGYLTAAAMIWLSPLTLVRPVESDTGSDGTPNT